MALKNFFNRIRERLGYSEEGGVALSETQSIALTLFIGAIIVIIIGIILYSLFSAILGLIPTARVKVTISGPTEVKAGELIAYSVTCENTGNVALENPELFFVHPANSWPEKEELTEIVRVNEFQNTLFPKETKTFYFKTRLFGTEGSTVEAKAWLNYNKKNNQNIIRSSVAVLDSKIASVPIDISLDIPDKISIFPETKSDFKFRVRYNSLADYSFSNLKVKVNYPSDLTIKETKPQKTAENTWEISYLEKRYKGELEIWGEFPRGETIGQEMNFSAQLYTTVLGEDILLKQIAEKSLTYKPVFLISQKINNDSEYVAYPDERLHYVINFQNISEDPLRDLTLTSVLEGNFLDFNSIECPEGNFTLGDNSILWNKEKIPELSYIRPGEEGTVEFWIKTKANYQPKDFTETNAIINNKVSLGGFVENFRNKVNTKIEIAQEGYYTDRYGFFENSGPQPPEVNKTTSYTIVWKINNYYNPASDVKIKATLPSYVRIKSIKQPTQGELLLEGGQTAPESAYAGIPAGFKFEHDLVYKTTSEEIKYLQIVLKKEVPYVYPSTTPVTGYFGTVTFNSVAAFQEKYKKEILEPRGLTKGTGFVDELTRTKLNELIASEIPIANAIVWQIKDLAAGVGVFSEPLIAAFQLTFTPTLSLKGKFPNLIDEVTLSGKDQWTSRPLYSRDAEITISLPDDPTVKKGAVQ